MTEYGDTTAAGKNLRCEWNLAVYKAKRDGLRGSTVSDSRR